MYLKLFIIGVDSLIMLKWSCATDILHTGITIISSSGNFSTFISILLLLKPFLCVLSNIEELGGRAKDKVPHSYDVPFGAVKEEKGKEKRLLLMSAILFASHLFFNAALILVQRQSRMAGSLASSRGCGTSNGPSSTMPCPCLCSLLVASLRY